jgi:transcriptional regulator with XRE-family HTH domain
MNRLEKIKQFRKQKNLSQAQIAESIGISQAAFAKIESGETKSITIEVGKGIAIALGIPFYEIFDIEPSKENSEQIEKLKIENESLKKQLEEKVQILELLKNEKAHVSLYLLMRLFGRLEIGLQALEAEILKSETEEEKIKLAKKKLAIASDFTFDKNYYINNGFITQFEYNDYFEEMKNVYTYIPDELKQ